MGFFSDVGKAFKTVGRGIRNVAGKVNEGLKQTKIISRVLPVVAPGIGGVIGAEVAKATGYRKGGRVKKMKKGGKVKKMVVKRK